MRSFTIPKAWRKKRFIVAAALAVAALTALVVFWIRRGRGVKETLVAPKVAARGAIMATAQSPWGVCFTKDGQYMFVGGKRLIVYRRDGSTFTEVRKVGFEGGVFHGLALSNSGTLLASGNNTSVKLFDVSKLIDPSAKALLRSTQTQKGASEVLFSSDDATLFVTLEYGEGMVALDVATLQRVRHISSDRLPVGMARHTLDGKPVVLFTTQFQTGKPYCPTTDCSGTLNVVDVATLTKTASVPAGCCPVRVASNGERVFVTARGEDRVKVLDKALQPVGQIPTGPAPVGIALAGNVLVVTASNRFSEDPGFVHFFDANTFKEIAKLEAQKFPRGVAVAPDGLVVVTNFKSDTLLITELPRH